MPKPRLPYVHKEIARGKTFWYYRRGHGPRVRLAGSYGDAEFLAGYRRASAENPVRPSQGGEGTFGWLWSLYRSSPAWARLSAATQKQRLNLIRPALARAGDQPLGRWDRKFILASLDARAATPAQARNFLGTLRALFQWALSREHADADPTVGIKVSRLRGDGFHAWTAAELAAFEARWPVGTRERLAFDLMLWTGLRRGDAARAGPAHVVDGRIELATAKTGQRVSIRILEPLALSIAATSEKRTQPSDTFIARLDGKPMVKEAFGNWFGAACRAAGVPGSAHGLRKALAIKLALAGAADREIGAILGNEMASLYARKASVPLLSDAALARLELK